MLAAECRNWLAPKDGGLSIVILRYGYIYPLSGFNNSIARNNKFWEFFSVFVCGSALCSRSTMC